jgi:tRNA G26 N,N-dimethylase Trm1
MKIIKFPGSEPKIEATNQYKMMMGPLQFSCDCGQVAELHFKNAIFRTLDFHCSACGTHYKLTNPAFIKPLPKKPAPPKI